MKRFFIHLGTVAMIAMLAVACDKDKKNDEPGGDEPEPPVVKKEYFVSPEGSGTKDGLTAENAFSFADLRDQLTLAMLAEVDDANPVDEGEGEGEPEPGAPAVPVYENVDLIDGYTINFAVGTYKTTDDAEDVEGLTIAFPGYSKMVDLTFKGSTGAALNGGELGRVLTIGGQVNLTIKGMTIMDGKLEEGNGGGISISSEEGDEAQLTLDGTVFTNNKVSTSSSGGAIHCGKAVVSASKCVFEADNYGRNGGSVYTNSSDAVVNCKDCTFKSHSLNTGGAANNSKGVQHYVDCIFDGCYTETGNGGAIHANAANCVVTVDGCQFKSCKARANDLSDTNTNKGAGIISVQQAEVTIDNCVFDGCEATTGALIYLQSGNGSTAASSGFLKCNNTRFINNKFKDRGLIQANGSKSNKQAAIGFFNNCLFYNNTMKTNQWGFILHGGNPSIACFNNCTIYGNTREQTGGNAVTLNTDGSIIFTNSTLIDAADLVSVRANDNSNNTRILLANSLLINSTTTSDVTQNVIGGSNTTKAPLYMYNNISGPAFDDSGITVTGDKNVTDATLASLGGSYDTGKGVYTWNGPASTFVKITPDDFETAVKTSLNVSISDFNAYAGTKTIGELYYDWLTDIGAIGKDALGTSRGGAWWPGAYQAN